MYVVLRGRECGAYLVLDRGRENDILGEGPLSCV